MLSGLRKGTRNCRNTDSTRNLSLVKILLLQAYGHSSYWENEKLQGNEPELETVRVLHSGKKIWRMGNNLSLLPMFSRHHPELLVSINKWSWECWTRGDRQRSGWYLQPAFVGGMHLHPFSPGAQVLQSQITVEVAQVTVMVISEKSCLTFFSLHIWFKILNHQGNGFTCTHHASSWSGTVCVWELKGLKIQQHKHSKCLGLVYYLY